MSFAQGLAAGLRPLPSVLLHNQRRAEEKALGEDIAGLTNEVHAREAEADPNFMGPPRAPVGEDNPELSRREQVRMTPAQTHQRMAGLYAKHGRPDAAANMLDHGMRATELANERDYRRGRDSKTDARQAAADARIETEFGWQAEDRNRQNVMRLGQSAYRALVSGENDRASQIIASQGDYLAKELGLGPDRKVVGVERVGDRVALSIENSKTGTTGTMTERASADPDDQVISFTLADFGQMVGIEPDRRFSDPKAMEGMGIGQFGPDGKWHSITSEKDRRAGSGAGGGAGGGASGIDSTDAQRVFGRARTGVEDNFRKHLGEQFMGDPEIAPVHAVAADTAYAVTEMGYNNGMQFVPERVGNYAAQLALSPEFQGLRRDNAIKMAEEERQGLPRGQRGDFDVNARAVEIQNQAAQRHHMAVMSAVFGEPEAFGALPDGAGSDEGAPAPGAQPGANASTSPQQRPVSPGGLTPAPTAGTERPQLTGESITDRLRAQNGSAARNAGLRVRESVAGHLEEQRKRRDEFRKEWLGDNPYEAERQAGLIHPAKGWGEIGGSVGGVAGSALDFAGGLAGGQAPAPPSGQAAGFFETVHAGRDPTPDQLDAAIIYARENPTALSEEEKAVLDYYDQSMPGSAN